MKGAAVLTVGSMLLPLLVQTTLAAQTPAARVTMTPKLDTPQARVIVATLPPHVASPSPNGHATNRVLIYLDDGAMTRREGTGPAETISFRRGDVRWRPASGAYVAENTGDRPIRILEVDLKGPPSATPRITALDAPLVDPTHYRVEFENDQVRVLRIHFEPHDKGAEHEHILNRVVVYMNDQANGRADDVRLAGAAVHSEQNDGDRAADRIAVELK